MASLSKRLEQIRPCALCCAAGGLFVAGARGGLRRCDCLRGRLLHAGDQSQQKRLEGFVDSGSSRAGCVLSGVRPQA